MINRNIVVISGGQTGADIGGVMGAAKLGYRTGGWMPYDWKTEAGPRPEYNWMFGMMPHKGGYLARTSSNVFDSHCTILFAGNWISGGTVKTLELLQKHKQPNWAITVGSGEPSAVAGFLRGVWHSDFKGDKIINIAGNRESVKPGIAAYTMDFMMRVLQLFDPQE